MAISETINALLNVNRVIHEPARLVLLSLLVAVESADFVYLANETGLTKGNLSSHLTRLEKAGYVTVTKTYKGKIPLTLYAITPDGIAAFTHYRQDIHTFLSSIPS